MAVQQFLDDVLSFYQRKATIQRKVADRLKYSFDAGRLDNYPSPPQVMCVASCPPPAVRHRRPLPLNAARCLPPAARCPLVKPVF